MRPDRALIAVYPALFHTDIPYTAHCTMQLHHLVYHLPQPNQPLDKDDTRSTRWQAHRIAAERVCPKPKTRPSASFVRYLSPLGLPAAPSRFQVNPTEGVSSAAPDLEFRGCCVFVRDAPPHYLPPQGCPAAMRDMQLGSRAYPKEAGQKLDYNGQYSRWECLTRRWWWWCQA